MLFLAPFLPALCLPAHRQPLTAVRGGFQLPGFLLKCFNTGFLRARLRSRGERKMAEELHKAPFIWGARFPTPPLFFCKKNKPLTRAVEAPPSCIPVESILMISCGGPRGSPVPLAGTQSRSSNVYASLTLSIFPFPPLLSCWSSGLDTEEVAWQHRD